MSAHTVTVDLAERTYEIRIGAGILKQAGEMVSAVSPARAVAIITDETVAGFYLEPLANALTGAGLKVTRITVPAGEVSKSFEPLRSLVESLLDAQLERRDCVIALGGGVVGDLAGFAAAITRRGMDIVQVPTTLLAQVDSSVGGKTGINTAHGKNLVGAFHQPLLVLSDTGTLDSLPSREFRAGYAELAKSALIDDGEFFSWLETNQQAIAAKGPELAHAIAKANVAKARIVAADERETGQRALLNLGHTFAHALEGYCRYDAKRLVHGEAVSIGTVLAHKFSAERGLMAPDQVGRIRKHFRKWALPTTIQEIPGAQPTPQDLVTIMAQDKKVTGGELTFILSRGIGNAYIEKNVPAEAIVNFLSGQLAETVP